MPSTVSLALAATAAAALALIVASEDRADPSAPDALPATSAAFAPHPAAEWSTRNGDGPKRVMLVNRLLDTACLIERNGERVRTLGACAPVARGGRRIRGWRTAKGSVRLVDERGTTLIEFALNAETGMSSVSTARHREAGAFALVPVAGPAGG